MNTLNDDMKKFFGKQLPFISTVSAEGKPNIGPKRTLRILDDNTLIYNENTGKQTLKNIKDNGRAAVGLVDWNKLDGYRYNCKAEVYTEGEYYDNCLKYAQDNKMGTPKAAVVLRIETINTLKIGPTAGDLVE